jgi:hypothetical protein
MRSISLFAKDFGHEAVLVPIIDRVAAQYEVKAKVRPVSVRGGFGRVASELKEYVEALLKYSESLPDLVVVATDANCDGFRLRRNGLRDAAKPIEDRVVYAVPDPHVERWLLRDPAAFKSVLGTPCKIPDQKCDRDRYKSLLIQAIRAAGASPLIGGMEYADDIVRQMDLGPTTKDDDFCAFLQDLHARFRLWTQGSAR